MGSGADLTFAQPEKIISLQVRPRYGKEFHGSDIPLFVVFWAVGFCVVWISIEHLREKRQIFDVKFS